MMILFVAFLLYFLAAIFSSLISLIFSLFIFRATTTAAVWGDYCLPPFSHRWCHCREYTPFRATMPPLSYAFYWCRRRWMFITLTTPQLFTLQDFHTTYIFRYTDLWRYFIYISLSLPRHWCVIYRIYYTLIYDGLAITSLPPRCLFTYAHTLDIADEMTLPLRQPPLFLMTPREHTQAPPLMPHFLLLHAFQTLHEAIRRYFHAFFANTFGLFIFWVSSSLFSELSIFFSLRRCHDTLMSAEDYAAMSSLLLLRHYYADRHAVVVMLSCLRLASDIFIRRRRCRDSQTLRFRLFSLFDESHAEKSFLLLFIRRWPSSAFRYFITPPPLHYWHEMHFFLRQLSAFLHRRYVTPMPLFIAAERHWEFIGFSSDIDDDGYADIFHWEYWLRRRHYHATPPPRHWRRFLHFMRARLELFIYITQCLSRRWARRRFTSFHTHWCRQINFSRRRRDYADMHYFLIFSFDDIRESLFRHH